MESLVEKIESSRIIAIIRGVHPDAMSPLFQALLEGGIEWAEITLNTQDALQSISQMNEQYGSRMVIGAGTVLDQEMAAKAIRAGARFLVSPNLDQGMIGTALSCEVLPIPGVMTPTEMVQAVKYGAPIVKLFPASSLGPRYLKEVMGPLDQVKIVAVGGIGAENGKEYIQSGAIALGVGGSLVNKKAIEQGDFAAITRYAMELKQSVCG